MVRRHLARDSRGKTSLSTLLILAAVVGTIYGGILFVPVYADSFSVQKAVKEAMMAAQANRNDAHVRAILHDKLRNVGDHEEYDGFGRKITVPGMRFGDDELLIHRDDVRGLVRVEARYERLVRLAPLDRTVRLAFTPAAEGPATTKW